MTLLELTLAVAIFAITVGVAAQSLISYYAAMDMQNQRVIAVNHCRTIFSEMRTIRDANPNTTTSPHNCQDAIVAQYPNGAHLAGPALLRNAAVDVAYENDDIIANPLVPTLTVQWQDLRGRTMTLRMSSAITDR